MGIELKKGENVFFPAPYVPSEPALLLVTDQRIIHFGEAGREEIEAKKVSFVGRLQSRPFIAMCVVMALIGHQQQRRLGRHVGSREKDVLTLLELDPHGGIS